MLPGGVKRHDTLEYGRLFCRIILAGDGRSNQFGSCFSRPSVCNDRSPDLGSLNRSVGRDNLPFRRTRNQTPPGLGFRAQIPPFRGVKVLTLGSHWVGGYPLLGRVIERACRLQIVGISLGVGGSSVVPRERRNSN